MELKSNGKYSITSRRGRQNLTVKDVTKEDQGEYSFVVDGKKTTCQLKMKRESSIPDTVVCSSRVKGGTMMLISPHLSQPGLLRFSKDLVIKRSARATSFSLKSKSP